MPGFVVCAVAAPEAVASVSPCADVDGVHYAPVVLNMDAPGTVSFDHADELFGWALTIILTAWLVGVCVGSILSFLRERE